MTRSQRRLLIDTGLLGLVLTLLVATLDYGGVLEPLERFFYDSRSRHCQIWTPPPTDKLVHLDIDDSSLEAIGRWPWPRSVHAELIDELHRAGCKIVCYDVIFPEVEEPGFEPLPATASAVAGPEAAPATRPATLPAADDPPGIVRGQLVDNDALFAESMKRSGRTIIPVSLQLGEPRKKSTLYLAMLSELYANPELSPDQLAVRLKAKKLNPAEVETEVPAAFITARREAIYDRIEHEMTRGARDLQDLRNRILPTFSLNIADSPQLTALASQYQRYLAVRALHRFAQPKQDGLPPLLLSHDEQPTIAALMEPAVESGYVDYLPMNDGAVRLMPLVVEHRGRLVPQMGLALACAMLDVKFKDVQLQRNRIVLPRPDGGRVEVPVRSHTLPSGRYGMFFDIPWFGDRDWKTMYDFPKYELKTQHVSIAFVWEARQMRQRMIRNNALADEALLFILSEVARDRFHAYRAPLPAPDDWHARAAMIDWVLKKLAADGTIEFYRGFDLTDVPEEERVEVTTMLQSHDALQRIAEQNRALHADLARRREQLREKFTDRAALVGYIAVAAVADQIPTSLHARCPGVVVHGVIFNSIMTGDFWRATPPWVSVLLTAVMGLLTTLVVVSLTPWKALAGASFLAAGYLLYNGLYFFDYRNLIVGVAGPVTAIGAVWAGGTFARYVLEAYERARVKRRLGNYVDPSLVEHLLETDDRMEGVRKDLTVVFTDLQGFTEMTEVLGERTVQVLNEYMSLMVPVVRRPRGSGGHAGLLNKFLGDGIMYFFGAPRSDADHAFHAVESVLEMQDVMIDFNRSLVQRNLPTLITRAGISSGEMIVGNAGPQGGSDYTVIGDVVNLGARLESANKFFGTRILLNERANALVAGRVLTRPIGKLQVIGKNEGVMSYEALALTEKATDAQKDLARLTGEMVTAYINANFDRCMQFVKELERTFQPSRLTDLYRSMCEQNLVLALTGFNGQITLTAK